jgi:Na+-transporting methylmalonyl-CoA/oxaloacetate decarboxylase gamma subunit
MASSDCYATFASANAAVRLNILIAFSSQDVSISDIVLKSNMTLNFSGIMAIVFACLVVLILVIGIIVLYLTRAQESPEDAQERLDPKATKVEQKKMKKEEKRKGQQGETENLSDGYYFGWTAAHPISG